MSSRIDVHGHYLPGVDDGCRNVAESLKCARTLVESGYSHAFCTPHIWPSLANNLQSILAGVESLQRHVDEAGIPLRLLPGAEYTVDSIWPSLKSARRDQIVSYGMNGRYVLFDFWAGSMKRARENVYAAVKHLQSMDFTPILAHPERIEALQREPDQIDRLIEMGVKLQLNSWCLDVEESSPIHQLAVRLMSADKYFVMGTDCHESLGMTCRMRGVQVAREMFGAEVVERLTVTNPRLLMQSNEAL